MPYRRFRHLRYFAALVAASVSLSFAGIAPATASPKQARLAFSTYSSSEVGPTGAYATLAMGHLHDTANTFWQILQSLPGSLMFRVITTGLATATNGGILIASNSAPPVVAVRASLRLEYSPILRQTSAHSTSWTPLRPIPGSIRSINQNAHAVTVVAQSGPRSSIETSSGPTSSFHAQATFATLMQAKALGTCHPRSLNAAALSPSGELAVGVTCASPGVSALFQLAHRTWSKIPLSGAVRQLRGTFTVQYLASTNSGIIGIAQEAIGERVQLYEISLVSHSPSMTLMGEINDSDVITGMGTTVGGGTWVTFHGNDGITRGFLKTKAHGPTTSIPPISSQDVTLVVRSNGALESVAVDGSGNVARIATLIHDPKAVWKVIQTVHVSLAYGSSG